MRGNQKAKTQLWSHPEASGELPPRQAPQPRRRRGEHDDINRHVAAAPPPRPLRPTPRLRVSPRPRRRWLSLVPPPPLFTHTNAPQTPPPHSLAVSAAYSFCAASRAFASARSDVTISYTSSCGSLSEHERRGSSAAPCGRGPARRGRGGGGGRNRALRALKVVFRGLNPSFSIAFLGFPRRWSTCVRGAGRADVRQSGPPPGRREEEEREGGLGLVAARGRASVGR